MAGTISIELRERLLRAYFRKESQHDDVLYVALTGAVPLANSSGASINEPSAGAYARSAVPLNTDTWALSGLGTIYNTQTIAFPAPAPGEDWGYLGGWALLDAPDSGITLAVGSLVLPIWFTSNLPAAALQPGAISISLYD